ncbi:MAG TPA: hypothetical protein VKB54_03925 [Solirubrobacteraceae bacterium]|nr:hypothetical protein [Solirubrobacteraceae bacterium]
MAERTGLSTVQRLALIAGAVVVLVVGYLLLQGGSDNGSKNSSATTSTATQPAAQGTTTAEDGTSSTTAKPAPPPVPTVRVVDAKPAGGIKKLDFNKGDQIRFRVVSDTADEIHVHGYDLMKDVPAGGSVTFSFKGSIDGRFVVELENHGQQIAELDVAP